MTAAIKEPGNLERRVVGTLVKTLLFHRRKARPRTIPAHLGAERFTVLGNSGARVVGHTYPARHGHARGVVVLAHPDKRYAQHWFVREGWIDHLLGEGYAVVTFDFSQYGETRGGSTYLHDDLLAVARYAHATHPGTPVHVIGVSIGAYAATNAAPRLDFVESLLLESPYPDFVSWYDHAETPRLIKMANATMAKIFSTTYQRINAPYNLAHAAPKRILVTAVANDAVTPEHLSREVATAGPAGRTQYIEFRGLEHLPFGQSAAYRDVVLRHLTGVPVPEAVAVESLRHDKRRAGPLAVSVAAPEANARAIKG